MAELKELFAIKDAKGNFVLDADEVAKLTGRKVNAVYESRKNDCRLDKLAIFEKAKELIEKDEQKSIVVTGYKHIVTNVLESTLDNSKRYEIIIKEME